MFVLTSRNQTFTPELAPETLGRLEALAARFRDLFNRPRQAAWCGVSRRGLIQDGDRKNATPSANRVPRPAGLDIADPDQTLQPVLGPSPGDEPALGRRSRSVMAGAFADPAGIRVFDDTTFPQQGQHCVGLPRPHGGVLGQKAHCQGVLSVHYLSPNGHDPLDCGSPSPGAGGAIGSGSTRPSCPRARGDR